MINRF